MLDLDTMEQRAREAKERADKATPGPWNWLGHNCYTEKDERIWRYSKDLAEERQLTNAKEGDIHSLSGGGISPILASTCIGYGGETDLEIDENDAEFIAAARTDVPALSADVLTLVSRLKAAENVCHAVAAYCTVETKEQVMDALEAWRKAGGR